MLIMHADVSGYPIFGFPAMALPTTSRANNSGISHSNKYAAHMPGTYQM